MSYGLRGASPARSLAARAHADERQKRARLPMKITIAVIPSRLPK